MRLGLWNRFAIASAVVALIVAPVVIWMDMAADSQEQRQLSLEVCNTFARGEFERTLDTDAFQAADQRCWAEFRRSQERYGPGWSEWRWSVAGTLAACVILYLFLWAIVATAKWIWRGRSEKISQSVN